ncbi:hypothetical protein K438DRAFT_1973932 [Mycena galopus ATCC 62051]|nr:hypothetical protein K438DRAFT_1973932 [Mycena galopus ATCC 62051]
MTGQRKLASLTTIPADIHFHLLSILPNFSDLGALILAHRRFHEVYKAGRKTLFQDVARNVLGCFSDEALLPARELEAGSGARYKLPDDPSTADISTKTALWIMNTNRVLKSPRDGGISSNESGQDKILVSLRRISASASAVHSTAMDDSLFFWEKEGSRSSGTINHRSLWHPSVFRHPPHVKAALGD